ncbi:Gfo/Idh/MocA family oxidoreductase [Candidatus Peregrinibacteria bacterium]|nr:Gfo/Idh/MocA family oxidoreductase [Candidatus Peregrinibacteria bacterium]MBI3816135.1 Gfo/Idh/MocA family oxidoreductase [Candidatus Peregrinibacteria bacterium]
MPKGRYRILVLGGGSIGTRHARNILGMGVGDVTVFEPDEERRATVKRLLDVQAIADEDEAFAVSKPDIVFVCSPTALHVPQALRAVETGAHVFIEKPLSNTMDGVAELREKTMQKQRVVMVGCNMRFHPGPSAVRELLTEESIGIPLASRISDGGYLPLWRPQQDYRKSYSASPTQGGAILDCIHEIDLALWYFGPGAVVGSCVLPATSIGLDTDGLAEMLIKHTSGVLSSVQVNFIQHDFRRSCHVIGTEGSLAWDIARGTVERIGRNGVALEVRQQAWNWETNHMYLDELKHFFHAVERQTLPFGSLEEATQALAIALAVRHHP